MGLAGRPSQTGKQRKRETSSNPRGAFDEHQARLERMSPKRDTEHRRRVRKLLSDKNDFQAHAARVGATLSDGVPAPGVPDGVHLFQLDHAETDRWRVLAGVNHFLTALCLADVTSEYPSFTEVDPLFAKLILVRDGRAVAFLTVANTRGDRFDGLQYVWVAGNLRGQGVGAELVAAARAGFAIRCVVGPLNEQRGAAKFAATVAPDLPVTAQRSDAGRPA
jgi:GNAT superfamily N-acetyltransferase